MKGFINKSMAVLGLAGGMALAAGRVLLVGREASAAAADRAGLFLTGYGA